MQQGVAEELLGKLGIVVVLEHGQQGLRLAVCLAELLDGLQHKGGDDFQVVVPVERFLFEQLEQLLVGAEHILDHLFPELAIVLIRIFGSLHILFVDVALDNPLREVSQKFGVVGPGDGFLLVIIPVIVAISQLLDKAVVDKAHVGILLLGSCQEFHAGGFDPGSLRIGQLNHQGQQQMIQLVGFFETEEEFLFGIHHRLVFRQEIGVGNLYDFGTD